ncbi:hypothetical protein CAPTEDRAFT_216271 [Capitella teleta]|uniref:Glycosyl transferase 64 domain-containing protein n=1 Tax=Capitella teleta TaxID=283909 RepID=R7VM42_CAPTE|nr:hypothetical protein CAPTEDRAFT_216271 [Capitella teleta]|eukprot:ELU18185.1 hypothetical protein CAPTEDRAFT_216271 [Capitella teleta]
MVSFWLNCSMFNKDTVFKQGSKAVVRGAIRLSILASMASKKILKILPCIIAIGILFVVLFVPPGCQESVIHGAVTYPESHEAFSHPEQVDVRLIILTHNRYQSLQRTLNALNFLELDGYSGHLDIFVDRNERQELHLETVKVAESFTWSKGPSRVHLQDKHVGIYGQWVDSWRPPLDSNELAIIIEDDIEVSPFAYRWLRQTHARYGHKDFISGYCLQDSNIRVTKGKNYNNELNRVEEEILLGHPAYFFRVAGSWAFAPHPVTWRLFQDWFHSEAKKVKHPYVCGAKLNTDWYKVFEKQHREDSMWTMWYIYFTDKHGLSALVSNIPQYTESNNSLVCNRLVAGLHYGPKREKFDCDKELMKSWSDSFVATEPNLPLIGYNGSLIGFR